MPVKSTHIPRRRRRARPAPGARPETDHQRQRPDRWQAVAEVRHLLDPGPDMRLWDGALKLLASPAPVCWACAGTVTPTNPPSGWISAADLSEPGLYGVGIICRNCARDGNMAIVRRGLASAGNSDVELQMAGAPGWA